MKLCNCTTGEKDGDHSPTLNTHQPNPGGRGEGEGEGKSGKKKVSRVKGRRDRSGQKSLRRARRIEDRQRGVRGERTRRREQKGTPIRREERELEAKRKRSEALIDGVCAGLHCLVRVSSLTAA
ncbi:hypothetical protein BO94DRAFT_112799 [Aspergillus sclerotioniger CBS 115572]|uniref:Uncharacterized protein n=1 Tax=Aspergillus sclerotioniger CBS 115572 TaxID=1450535 RepID=A0A317WB48_9EURO|nr:hypothetical protein BO94DRAFT_112799 [Aspergillus sclerotioniger CBS 115572]PWY83714.1 hypothetical protein BO94DRAFT_112799 [Aspergillus sclerotioniger CBS 115572]